MTYRGWRILGSKAYVLLAVSVHVLGASGAGADVSRHRSSSPAQQRTHLRPSLLQVQHAVGPDALGDVGAEMEVSDSEHVKLVPAKEAAPASFAAVSKKEPLAAPVVAAPREEPAGRGMQLMMDKEQPPAETEFASVRFDRAVEHAHQTVSLFAAGALAALAKVVPKQATAWLSSTAAAGAVATSGAEVEGADSKDSISDPPTSPGAMRFFSGISRVAEGSHLLVARGRFASAASMVAVDAKPLVTATAEPAAVLQHAVEVASKRGPLSAKEQLALMESLAAQHASEVAQDQDLRSQGALEDIMASTREESRWR